MFHDHAPLHLRFQGHADPASDDDARPKLTRLPCRPGTGLGLDVPLDAADPPRPAAERRLPSIAGRAAP